jgi:hypothetical protein
VGDRPDPQAATANTSAPTTANQRLMISPFKAMVAPPNNLHKSNVSSD